MTVLEGAAVAMFIASIVSFFVSYSLFTSMFIEVRALEGGDDSWLDIDYYRVWRDHRRLYPQSALRVRAATTTAMSFALQVLPAYVWVFTDSAKKLGIP